MTFLPDTNACVALLRGKNLQVIARWRAAKSSGVVLCAIVVYELYYGAERSVDPAREHAKLDVFLRQFASLIFDDRRAVRCAKVRHDLERTGLRIGPLARGASRLIEVRN